MAARALLLVSLQALAAEGAKPLVSMDIVYDTFDLMSGAFTDAWTKAKAGVDGMLAKLPTDDLKKHFHTTVTANIPPEHMKQLDTALAEATARSVQVKALAGELAESVYEPANKAAVAAIDQFETLLPKYRGLIPKSLGNLVLFAVYMLIVLYLVFKVASFVFRTAWSIFCCFCCCGCCRGSKKEAAPAKKGKSEKGKATNAPAAKAESKAAGKKK
mmetsp:Transcript_53953/g.106472  ORF Transcript_53953/g.106472 Transcript_53953/m.106472 type:complete len:216 (-) Transcript_53953:115-762(-)